MDGVQLPQGYSHFEEAVYILLSYVGLHFYPNEDCTSFKPFLVVCKCAVT